MLIAVVQVGRKLLRRLEVQAAGIPSRTIKAKVALVVTVARSAAAMDLGAPRASLFPHESTGSIIPPNWHFVLIHNIQIS